MELDVVVKRHHRGPETDFGAALVGCFQLLERIFRLAMLVFLLPVVAVSPDVEHQLLRQGVHHGNAHAVQAARHLVAVVIELAAGMQDGHHHFGRGDVAPMLLAFLGVPAHRNATAIVPNRDRTVVMDGHLHRICMTGQCLVHAIVDHLEHHMVQAGTVMDIADVHARPLAHSFQTFQGSDAIGIVVPGVGGRAGGFGLLARGLFVLRHRRDRLPRRAGKRAKTH